MVNKGRYLFDPTEIRKKYNCPCLKVAGQLNFTREGFPIEDCCICNGTGYCKSKSKNEKVEGNG